MDTREVMTRGLLVAGCLVFGVLAARAEGVSPQSAAQAYVDYFEAMMVPKPFEVLKGEALNQRHAELRSRLLKDMGLDSLPERVPLDIHRAEPIDHPWCSVTKLAYQVWPGVYTRGVLYMPKEFPESPAPANLSPHGHWDYGYAYTDVQKRCVMLAKLGYVTFCPEQSHLEDLPIGFSHQTLMVWNNMRALDLLQSLPEVDPNRIGVSGMSGGGLQTQMILALDPTRIKAAMVGGLTCDTREIAFPHAAHCGCNHFPNYMRYTDHPEISSMGFPAALGFLTMRDWTARFRYDNFPTIQAIYRDNGKPEHAYCGYWPTPHIYDQKKREVTYWWMEQYARGVAGAAMPEEPETIQTVLPDKALNDLPVEVPNEKGLQHVTELFREQFMYDAPALATRDAWSHYASTLAKALPELLGMSEALPAAGPKGYIEHESVSVGDALVSRGTVHSEGPFVLPVEIISPAQAAKDRDVVVLLSPAGFTTNASNALPADVASRVREGQVVVLPDVRYTGAYQLAALAGTIGPELRALKPASDMSPYATPKDQDKFLHWAAERNSIVWGRPIAGQMVTDILAVIDAMDSHLGSSSVTLVTRDAGYIAAAALFAAVLDTRITALDVDTSEALFAEYKEWWDAQDKLTVVPFILRHGDMAQWAAAVADRQVTLRRLSKEVDQKWLASAFSAAGNADGLRVAD